ncbi:hypothetical protein [Kineosporia succinea]|uniref:Uncharacterized protein n=1 Tax=Kineosporia succinea TaxID=84632 RepID=A0ABT9PBH6_9ACTN|nr:hypothetical protein [Kineosporia succinea]MDP9829370.1 hypothetical protein [Kineosporia succinea]
MSNVTPLRKPSPTPHLGALDCTWAVDVNRHDAVRLVARRTSGIVTVQWKLEQCAGDLDPQHVARLHRLVLGDVEPGVSALMYADIEAGQL